MRQVPALAATAYLFDLAAARGPRFVVLRLDAQDAKVALVEHLVDVGAVVYAQDAWKLLADASVEPVGVVW